MRTRNIKPGFFRNELLAKCEPLARLLFAGLWCLADRDGRLEDRPERIKVDVLPYDNCDVNAMLTTLHNLGFIIRYEADALRLIQVVNFSKHGKPHPQEVCNDFPAPTISPVKFHGETGSPTKESALTLTLSSYSNSNSNSSLLITEARLPPSGGEPAGKADTPPDDPNSGQAVTPPKAKTPRPPKKPREPNPLFDAVAEVTSSDPKVSGAHIGRICKLLNDAEPAYSPDEVRRWAQRTREQWGIPPTLGMIEKYIGKIRSTDPGAFDGRPSSAGPDLYAGLKEFGAKGEDGAQ